MLHMVCGNHIIGGIGEKIGEYGLTFCCFAVVFVLFSDEDVGSCRRSEESITILKL